MHPTHLAGVGDVGPPVGLFIDEPYLYHPDWIDRFRDEIDLCSDEVGIGQGSVSRQEEHRHFVFLRQGLVESHLDVLAEFDGDRVQLEVHPSLPRLHVPSGHLGSEVSVDHRSEHVEGGVRAHERVTSLPVDPSRDLSTDSRRIAAEDMQQRS